MKNIFIIIFSLTLLISVQNTTIAQATRTWVSGVGDDVNPCSRTAPCKTFAGAISKTAEFGEINVLDPGGFGAVTITKSITISSEGFEAGIVVSLGTNAVIINTIDATDKVVLRGIDFEGLGTASNGIRVLNAESVIIENCTFNGFSTAGVSIEPTANPVKIVIKDSRISNSSTGISLIPTGAIVADVNVLGVLIGMNTTGITSTGTGSTLRLSNSSIINNATSVGVSTGKIVSFGNNNFAGNTINNPITVTQQQ